MQAISPNGFSLIRKFCFCFRICIRPFQALPLIHRAYSCFLLFSCSLVISCFLIKAYGEVHVDIRGSSHFCTGKFTKTYGEVHISVRGSSSAAARFQLVGGGYLYGEVHICVRVSRTPPCQHGRLWRCVRGSSHLWIGVAGLGRQPLYGEVHLAELSHPTLGRVVHEQGARCTIYPDTPIGRFNPYPWPQ